MTDSHMPSADSLALGACLASRGHRPPPNREFDFEHEVIVCDHAVKAALLPNAASVILARCPSGDPTSSPDEYAITQRLVDGGEILGVPVQDHVIIGSPGRAWSFRAAGEMPTCRQIAEPGSARPGRAPGRARPGPG